jgi:PAS domain S-box-containing protein
VRQLETELEEFFDLSIDPLSIIGFDGEFKRVNASFVRLLGYPEPELFSRSAYDILHPDDVEPARGALAQLAEGHELVGFEARVISASSSPGGCRDTAVTATRACSPSTRCARSPGLWSSGSSQSA